MTAAELINALLAQGLTMRQIADAMGRHNSLLYQIRAGKKSGAYFVPALQTLLDTPRGEGQAPAAVNVPRRTDKTGAPRKVRQAPVRGSGWRTTMHGKQASRSGVLPLRHLREAAELGRVVGLTIELPPGFRVSQSGKGHHSRTTRKGRTLVTIGEGEGMDSATLYGLASSMGFAECLAWYLGTTGRVSPNPSPSDILSVEIRSWA